MSSINYEELVKNARAAVRVQEQTENNTRSWRNAFGLFSDEKINGRAIEKAQHYYGQLYDTLIEEVNGIGNEIALLSQAQADNFNKSVANSCEYEADSDILEKLLEEENEKKSNYESAKAAFYNAARSLYALLVPSYSDYCYSMADYYGQLVQLTEEIIEKLEGIKKGIYKFEEECSSMYENVFSRLDVLEGISKTLGLDRGNVGFELPQHLQEKLKTIQNGLKNQRISALFEEFDITIVGETATAEIDINRNSMCMNGVNDVDTIPIDAKEQSSCAWFVSNILYDYGGILEEKKGDYTNGWYRNRIENAVRDGSKLWVNADELCNYFSGKPYTTTYQITGTIDKKADALKAMQEAGLYNDGDLLFFDQKGEGTQDHVVILNGRYDSESAIGDDKTPNAQNYNKQPAFFGQNDNHHSFSVRENLMSHSEYSDSTILTVVAFNG